MRIPAVALLLAAALLGCGDGARRPRRSAGSGTGGAGGAAGAAAIADNGGVGAPAVLPAPRGPSPGRQQPVGARVDALALGERLPDPFALNSLAAPDALDDVATVVLVVLPTTTLEAAMTYAQVVGSLGGVPGLRLAHFVVSDMDTGHAAQSLGVDLEAPPVVDQVLLFVRGLVRRIPEPLDAPELLERVLRRWAANALAARVEPTLAEVVVRGTDVDAVELAARFLNRATRYSVDDNSPPAYFAGVVADLQRRDALAAPVLHPVSFDGLFREAFLAPYALVAVSPTARMRTTASQFAESDLLRDLHLPCVSVAAADAAAVAQLRGTAAGSLVLLADDREKVRGKTLLRYPGPVDSASATEIGAWVRRSLVDLGLVPPAPSTAAQTLHNKALERHGEGDEPGAAALFQDAVKDSPHYAIAHLNLAGYYQSQGRETRALESFRRASLLNRRLVPAFEALGRILHGQKRDFAAAFYFRTAADLLLQEPPSKDASHKMLDIGTFFTRAQFFPEAARCYHLAMLLAPMPEGPEPGILLNIANALSSGSDLPADVAAAEWYAFERAGHIPQALIVKARTLVARRDERGLDELLDAALRPGLWADIEDATIARCLVMTMDLMMQQNMHARAVRLGEAALPLQPNSTHILISLGNALNRLRRYDAAIVAYQKAVAELEARDDKNLAGVLGNLGQTQLIAGEQPSVALATLERALALRPDDDLLMSNVGMVRMYERNYTGAVAEYEAALALNPFNLDALAHMGKALIDLNRVGEAIPRLEAALAINPRDTDVMCDLILSRNKLCVWQERAQDLGRLAVIVQQQLEAGREPCLMPISAIGLVQSPLLEQLSAQFAASRGARGGPSGGSELPPLAPRGAGARLRIGYVSSDLRAHPVTYLMADVFGRHDAEAVVAFSLNRGRDAWTDRIGAAVTVFESLHGLTADEAAARIRAHNLDLLVDLNGHTDGARQEILARRPARKQMHMLGLPASTQAAYIDYFLADAVAVPAGSATAATFSEAVLRMPRGLSFLPASHAAVHPSPAAMRELRRNGTAAAPAAVAAAPMVFCNFNQHHKVTPSVFAAWMRILVQVPESVLWMQQFAVSAEEALAAEARELSVDPSRLVFGDKAPFEMHLAIKGHCDLFLDTEVYNGHSTVADMLWAGVPVLTFGNGTGFAGRVALSLVSALGLDDEMTAASLAAYEARAVALAQDRPALERLRGVLAERIDGGALFDTARWVREFEAVVSEVMEQDGSE